MECIFFDHLLWYIFQSLITHYIKQFLQVLTCFTYARPLATMIQYINHISEWWLLRVRFKILRCYHFLVMIIFIPCRDSNPWTSNVHGSWPMRYQLSYPGQIELSLLQIILRILVKVQSERSLRLWFPFLITYASLALTNNPKLMSKSKEWWE